MAGETELEQTYWQAEDLVTLSLSRFQEALRAERSDRQRSIFYRLASFHGRTLRVLNSGLHKQNELLVQSALHNLQALHLGMMQLHRWAPHIVPLPVILSEHSRDEFVRDLVMRVLAETPPALPFADIQQRTNLLNMLGQVPEAAIHKHLQDLIRAQHVIEEAGRYVRTTSPYVELNKNVASLRALVGRRHFAKFSQAGYDSVRAISDRQDSFRPTFAEITGFSSPQTADAFLEVIDLILNSSLSGAATWRFHDLIGSPFPRPYQRNAFLALQENAYDNLVIDAPTGSGKTLIGMLCIQDWLKTLGVGQSVMVVVPTSNYQQQWLDELCYNPIGLRLPPEIIFSGTPADINRYQQLTGRHPAVLIITYTALSQLGSPVGKGGFDAQSVEMFLQQTNVKYVILDEVHKVVEDQRSVVADVTRLLIGWQQDTSLRALVGFSGTASAYRSRFEALGQRIVYEVPIDDLVAAGFVAPFAELGVPFAFSGRERRIRELLDAYKENLRRYFALLGPQQLRGWFANIPLDERRLWGHAVLGMYRGRADWAAALDERFREWEAGPAGELKITAARMVLMIQLANGWSDREMARSAGIDETQFGSLLAAMEAIKTELQTLVYLPKTLERLSTPGFAGYLDAGRLRAIASAGLSAGGRTEMVKDLLATTLTGLYDGLSDWYLRTGEGRVATIKAVIEAEQAARKVSGTIVFDSGRHIPWRSGLCMPGYQGTAGLFSELLGDPRFTVMAVLSNEMYLTLDEATPITQRIADFILEELVIAETAQAVFNLLVSGLNLSAVQTGQLRERFNQHMQAFLPVLETMHAARPGAFNQKVLKPLRKDVRQLKLGLGGERLLTRIDPRNVNLKRLVQTLFDLGLLAMHFREPSIAEVEQVSGARQKFFVVTMPGGARRKQQMYALTARLVDAESVPVNLVIVTNWARTGWNVIQPNLLIDATATRDVTAWQQLRGRAIRAWRTWNNDCYRLLSQLIGHDRLAAAETGLDSQLLDEALWRLLGEIATLEQQDRIRSGGLAALEGDERGRLALTLMQRNNKVTHIFELVKASGATSQVNYDRARKAWSRRENVALKHEKEIAVNPFTGRKTSGEEHAPLVYAQDPRSDVPAELQQHLINALAGCDDVIISGWLHDGRVDTV